MTQITTVMRLMYLQKKRQIQNMQEHAEQQKIQMQNIDGNLEADRQMIC